MDIDISSHILLKTIYNTREDIDVLFDNSTQVYGYYDTVEGGIFLSSSTQDQYESLVNQGYESTILDSDFDPSNYIYLSSYSPIEASDLSQFSSIYQIDDNHVLVQFDSSSDSELVIPPQYQIIPLTTIDSPPPYYSKTISSVPIEIDTTSYDYSKKESYNSTLIIGMIIGSVVVISIFLYLKRKHSKLRHENIE